MAEKPKTEGMAGIHPEVLKSLIAKCDSVKADMDEARGEVCAAIKDAEEVHGIDREAFKLAPSLRRMGQGKRDDFVRSLEDHVDKLNLQPQDDLFDEVARRTGQDAKAENIRCQVRNREARTRAPASTSTGSALEP